MRIVIDTNVVVSGIFFGGLPNELLRLVIKKEIFATVSNEIIDEYYKTFSYLLNSKKYKPKEDITLNSVIEKMKIIFPASKVEICRDPDDDKFIACAIDGKCKYIVSGDKDLLELKSFKNVEIVTVREFMNELSEF
ncbi:MAG: putative toxin-antitoxin system toxin component, PIN family [Chitinivibrionia bacterium]|nr:putative toxin-antitoxin system toxin component, PIN family [Chitinivibrionia bacterium]